jgi:hypothetical protein
MTLKKTVGSVVFRKITVCALGTQMSNVTCLETDFTDQVDFDTHPPIQWVPGIKRPGREADYSPPTSAMVKITWVFTSSPLYTFMA